MTDTDSRNVLLIGLGGFGNKHLRGWLEMGFGERLYVVDPNPDALVKARWFGIGTDRCGRDLQPFLSRVDAVDLVTPSDTHVDLAMECLRAGKHVLVEKPMAMDVAEATELASVAQTAAGILQVGYYYRYHPCAEWLRDKLQTQEGGRVRYAKAEFFGFKRPRTDVGAILADGVHFLDLFNHLFQAFPCQVKAWARHDLGRPLEDFGLIILEYPGDILVNLECGYLQPGRHNDPVVPGAVTTKEITLCCEEQTYQVDFEACEATQHDVRQVPVEGVDHAFTLDYARVSSPRLNRITPVQQLRREFRSFLDHAAAGETPGANAWTSGVSMATLVEAIYESVKTGSAVDLELSSYPGGPAGMARGA